MLGEPRRDAGDLVLEVARDLDVQDARALLALDVLPIGPQPRTLERLETELTPLELLEQRRVDIDGGPFPFLGKNRLLQLWFRR